MALTPDFSVTQTIGEPSIISLEDTSAGSDGTITQRRVYITKADQTTLVEDGTSTAYELWTGFPGTTTIDLDVLDKDYVVVIRVDWLTAGDVVTYTKSHTVMVSLYNEDFYYSLTQDQTANPILLSNPNFYNNKKKLRVELDSASQAVSFASDQYAGQACLDRATFLRLNNQLFL